MAQKGTSGDKALWNRAYQNFTTKSPELEAAFKEILSSEFSASIVLGSNILTKEQEMSRLVRHEVTRMENREWKIKLGIKSIRIRSQVERILKILSFAQELSSQAAELDPVNAGLPVAGLYLILSFVTRDKDSRESLFNGLESISNIVRKYASVESVYLSGGLQSQSTERLKEVMIILYEQILQFEAKAACYCNHNIAYQTFRNLFAGSSSWTDGVKAIQGAETTCASMLPILDQETQLNSSERLLEISARQNELIERSVLESEKQSQAIVEELKHSRMAQEHAREAEEQRQCLTTLRTTDYAAPKKLLPRKAPGTCEWFLQHPKYREWLKADASALLWVTADPGCGKSVLAKFLVDDFLRIIGAASHVCYFFFRAGTEMESPLGALCAMLHQLFCQDEGLLTRHGLPQYQQNGSKLASLSEPLWEMFTNCYQDPERDELICVVDALDECDPEEDKKKQFISQMVEMIADQDRKVKVKGKFLITGRPDTLLRNTLFDVFGSTPFPLFEIRGEEEHETNALAKEINLVIDDSINRFKRTREALSIHDGIHQQLQEKIFEVENRTYLWVSIIFMDLQAKAGSSKEDLLLTLQTLPTKVETAYQNCLKRIPPAEIEDAKRVLRIIIAAVRDLNLKELKIAFTITRDGTYRQLNTGDETSTFADKVRHLCGLLIRIEGSVVSLIHQTAREFLVNSLDSPRMLLQGWQGSLNLAQAETALAQCCIWYLNSHTFDEAWMKLKGGEWKASGFDTYIKQHAFVEYAARYWTLHFRSSSARAGDALCSDAARLCEMDSHRYRTWSKIYWNSFDRRAPRNTTNMSIAVAYNMVEVINELVSKGYDVNTQDDDGDTALHAAALHGSEDAARCLIRHQASTTIKAKDGNTPLHTAAARGSILIVKIILENGGDLEEINNQGRTPLHRAALFGHPGVLKTLLEVGAKVDTKDLHGRTALHLASLLGTEDIKSGSHRRHGLSAYEDVINLLIHSGCDQSMVDNENTTATALLQHALWKALKRDSSANVTRPPVYFETAAAQGFYSASLTLVI